ncbi:MAG: VOC family protein [Candidatus Dormiibacterota bacterium]
MTARLAHFEILGPDDRSLVAFYHDLLGWPTDSQGPGYTLVHLEGGPGGAIIESPDSRVTLDVTVADLDATVARVRDLGGQIPMPTRKATPSRPSKTAHPQTAEMPAGYSGTPQARKLGVKAQQRVSLDRPPDGWSLTDPPADLTYVEAPEPADVIIGFFTASEQLPWRLPELTRRIYPSGALWIAWPRRAGGHESDITDNIVRSHALALGVVDIKVAAIDHDWSGQRVVWRISNRNQP